MSRALLKRILPQSLINFARRTLIAIGGRFQGNVGSAQFWTDNHVDAPVAFTSAKESLDHLAWRNCLYPGSSTLMPVDGADGKTVLDYGCGPGNDVIGFMEYSKPAKMVAMDVSPTALKLASARAELHGFDVEFHHIPEAPAHIPLPGDSVDLVHSAGVIHHTVDPEGVLREINRVLKPDGTARIMVYHRDSIWMHLFVGYETLLIRRLFPGLTKEEAFHRTTDGPHCPIAHCYSAEEFLTLAKKAGLHGRFVGSAMSVLELERMSQRWEALRDKRLDRDSREFLADLTFDERGYPCHAGRVAGINGYYELTRVE